MIDTMKLTLDKNMFWVTDLTLFQKERQEASRGYFTLVQNPTKSEMRNGFYKPRLTMTRRFNASGRHESTLSIEFSVPKLLYGNNFDEITDKDLLLVVDKLQEILKSMGIKVFHNLLLSAPVSTIHYSKNIPLTDGTTPHYLIRKIKDANTSLVLDVNQTDYRNDGYSYKWHSNSYEVAFYDKIKDLEQGKKSDKRAIENDTILQLNLFDQLRSLQRLEILRMEVRLNNRQKMKQLFKNLNIQNELTLQSVFKAELSVYVLLYYLSILEKQRLKILDYSSDNSSNLLADIIVNNPKLGTLKVLQAFGLKQALTYVTPRELRAMFGKRSMRSWYRLIADAKNLRLPITSNPFETIRKHLTDFVPVKLVDFQLKVINNDKYT